MTAVVQKNKGGRPRKVDPKATPEGQRLASLIAAAELECVDAVEAFRLEPSMAAKVRLLAAELRAATLQRAWCLLDGNHTYAIRWSEQAAKLSREHAAAAESTAIDEARQLAVKAAREDALSKRLGG